MDRLRGFDVGGLTRRAPDEMRLPVPRFVRVWSAILGATTAALGFVFLTALIPNREADLEPVSVVARIEDPLGWAMLAAGGWVVAAAIVGHSRASAHAVAAVIHGAHLTALTATVVIAWPLQPLPAVLTALFAVVAHGGASLEYWQRGWR